MQGNAKASVLSSVPMFSGQASAGDSAAREQQEPEEEEEDVDEDGDDEEEEGNDGDGSEEEQQQEQVLRLMDEEYAVVPYTPSLQDAPLCLVVVATGPEVPTNWLIFAES